MRLPISSRILVFSLVALLCGATSTRADYITGELNDVGNKGIYGGILNPGASVMINDGAPNSNFFNYYPGVVNWTVESPTDPLKLNADWVSQLGSTFTTFCIEVPQEINPGKIYTFELTALALAPDPGTTPSQEIPGTPGMGATKANAIEELWAQDYAYIANPTNSYTADINAAAFQLAIWKIEYDWGTANFDNFSAGNFRAENNDSAITLAMTWLDYLHSNPGSVTPANLVALSDPNLQDQVMELPPLLSLLLGRLPLFHPPSTSLPSAALSWLCARIGAGRWQWPVSRANRDRSSSKPVAFTTTAPMPRRTRRPGARCSTPNRIEESSSAIRKKRRGGHFTPVRRLQAEQPIAFVVQFIGVCVGAGGASCGSGGHVAGEGAVRFDPSLAVEDWRVGSCNGAEGMGVAGECLPVPRGVRSGVREPACRGGDAAVTLQRLS